MSEEKKTEEPEHEYDLYAMLEKNGILAGLNTKLDEEEQQVLECRTRGLAAGLGGALRALQKMEPSEKEELVKKIMHLYEGKKQDD